MKRLLNWLVSLVTTGVAWPYVSVGLGAAAGAISAVASGMRSPWLPLFAAGMALATFGVVKGALSAGSAIALTRWPEIFGAEKARAVNLRRSLVLIYGELDSARRLLEESLERHEVWDPNREELPAEMWRNLGRELVSESGDALDDIHGQLDDAYQRCNRFNHFVRTKLARAQAEFNQSGPVERAIGWDIATDEDEEAELQETLDAVTHALNEFADYLYAPRK